ncbi:hypothetical protein B4145_1392 [Bacillus subtilis]|nr:hypothetical protein B4145_1392 [Bacillus subtilis]
MHHDAGLTYAQHLLEPSSDKPHLVELALLDIEALLYDRFVSFYL